MEANRGMVIEFFLTWSFMAFNILGIFCAFLTEQRHWVFVSNFPKFDLYLFFICRLFAVTKRYSWTRFELTTILLHIKTCFAWSLFCKWKPLLIFWISVAQKGSLSCVLKTILYVSKNPTVRLWPCKAGFSDFFKTSVEN